MTDFDVWYIWLVGAFCMAWFPDTIASFLPKESPVKHVLGILALILATPFLVFLLLVLLMYWACSGWFLGEYLAKHNLSRQLGFLLLVLGGFALQSILYHANYSNPSYETAFWGCAVPALTLWFNVWHQNQVELAAKFVPQPD